eukprot:gene9813-biopygen9228
MPRNREFLERSAEQRLPACRRAYLDCTVHFCRCPRCACVGRSETPRPTMKVHAVQRPQLSAAALSAPQWAPSKRAMYFSETAWTAVRLATLRGGQANGCAR